MNTPDSNGNYLFEHIMNIIPSVLEMQSIREKTSNKNAGYDYSHGRTFDIIDKIIQQEVGLDQSRLTLSFDKYISAVMANKVKTNSMWGELIKQASAFCDKYKLITPSYYNLITAVHEYEHINEYR